MVSPAPIPLSPRELELLTTFVVVDFDLKALVDRLKLTPQDTLDFLESDPIRASLQSIKGFTDLADHLFNFRQHRSAISALTASLSTTTDPIERRRAATTILRFTTTAPARSGGTGLSGGTGPSGGTGVPPVSSSPPSVAPSLRPSVASSARPSVASTPAESPESLSLAITDATSRGESCIPILRQALTPSATINGTIPDLSPRAVTSPTAPRPIIILESAIALLSRARIGDDARVEESLLTLTPAGEVHPVHIAYTRIDPRRWAIAQIEVGIDAGDSDIAPPHAHPLDSS